jgi:hypothetical protein
MSDLLDQLRDACARVSQAARHVEIKRQTIPAYAASLPIGQPQPGADPDVHLLHGSREQLAAFWLTLDAINFGSGWFPTLRKRHGRSGYHTIAGAVRDRFTAAGAWSAGELETLDAAAVAAALRQDAGHELMGLFAASLNDLGSHIEREHRGSFAATVDSAEGSALALVERLAEWECFRDSSTYNGVTIPFLKRAQIAAADLERVEIAELRDLDRLTMFADNVVPHVLRLDGILRFSAPLAKRIERGELIEHGSPEEVEIRACALHAVEQLVSSRPGTRAADVDQLLWLRGQGPRYKARPRHRCRCTAY